MSYLPMPKIYIYITTNYMDPKTQQRLNMGTITHSPKTIPHELCARTIESPNAPRSSPCLGPQNRRKVEREYNDSMNGHPRA